MIDKIELKKTWDLFVGDNGFTEVRILGRFQYSGYFKSFENLCVQLEPYTNMDDEQIYFVMNKISADCYARPQCEKFIKSPKSTTKDDEIISRQFLLCDFDPIRIPNISSTPEQFELAHKKAQEVYKYLKDECDFNDMAVAISGSGWHLLIPVDIPCNDETDKIIKDFYAYMGNKFTDDKVEYDVKVYNRSRITKLYSVVSKKGANVPSNPWRQSKIVYIPKVVTPTSLDKIKKLADLAPKEEPKPQSFNRGFQAPFNLRSWLDKHGIKYREKSNGSGMMYELEWCPWLESHSDRKKWDSALFVDTNGRITFNCTHSHCKDKRWQDVRLFYEPNAYDRQPQYMPMMPMPFMRQQKPKYEIKEELPELGGKWLCMSDIQKIDLSSLENVKTGFTELDHAIVGLNMSEVTLLSGSNSSGKSSWLNSLLLNIVQQGTNVALWSGELRPDILKAWIQMVAAGKEHLRPSSYGDGKYYVPQGVGEQIDHWLDGRFFLYNNEYGTKWQQIFHDMQELLKAQVKVFVLDNLFSLDIDLFDGDRNNKQKELILQIKDFAKSNNVHIILVAHPRKSLTFLRKNDISGTSDLTNAVDNVFICHRVNNDFLRTGAEYFGQSEIQKYQGFGNVIEVCKNRMYGIVDYMVGMHYEIESRRFKNTQDEVIHYGWEENPTQQEMDFQQQVQNTLQPQSNGEEPPLWEDWSPSIDQAPF